MIFTHPLYASVNAGNSLIYKPQYFLCIAPPQTRGCVNDIWIYHSSIDKNIDVQK